MASKQIDIGYNDSPSGIASTAAGTVTNTVRVVYDDATPISEVSQALRRVAEAVEAKGAAL